MYGEIDYILIFSDFHTIGHPKQINYWEIQRNLKLVKNILCEDKIYDFDITKSKRITEIVETVWATPERDLLHSSSSGTTGLPKKVVNSHKKVYLMAERLAKIYFTKNDSVLHFKNMHHGASMCYHFLPGLMVGGKQFTANGVYGDDLSLDPVIKFAIDNKINQLFLYNPEYVLYFLEHMPRVDYRLNIITLFQITSEVVPLIKEKNINFIKSPFGDTTIGLGFFVKTVDQTTDIESYDVTNIGPILDDFFQIELRDGSLYVACQALNEDWRTSDDKFECIDGNYYFKGRGSTYRIGDEWIKLNDIEQKIKQLFGPNGANIVVDFEMQKIYLAVWEKNSEAEQCLNKFFDEQYKEVKISYILRNENYNHFFNSRKIDNSKIRQVCRQHLSRIK
jgi:acyl-CoA synthetase (AMP-forming)/AMP-acid ligase II